MNAESTEGVWAPLVLYVAAFKRQKIFAWLPLWMDFLPNA